MPTTLGPTTTCSHLPPQRRSSNYEGSIARPVALKTSPSPTAPRSPLSVIGHLFFSSGSDSSLSDASSPTNYAGLPQPIGTTGDLIHPGGAASLHGLACCHRSHSWMHHKSRLPPAIPSATTTSSSSPPTAPLLILFLWFRSASNGLHRP